MLLLKDLRKEIRMKRKLTGIISLAVAFAIVLSAVLTGGYGLLKTDDSLIIPENEIVLNDNTPEKTDPEKEEENNNQKVETPVVTPVVTPPSSENKTEIIETLPEGEDGEETEELLPGQIAYKDYPFPSTTDAVNIHIDLSANLAFKKTLLSCDGRSLSVKQGHTSSSATIALDFKEITFGGSNAIHIKVDATEQTDTSLIKFMLKAGKAAELKLGGEYYLIDNDGRVFKYTHSSNRSVSIPAGFNGYVVLDFNQFVMMNNQSLKLNEAEITGIQIQFQSVERDQTKTIRFSDFGMYYDFDSTEEVYNASYISLSTIDSSNYPYNTSTVDKVEVFNNKSSANPIGGYTSSLVKVVSGRVRLTQLHSSTSSGVKITQPYSSSGYTAVSIEVDNSENTTYSWLKFGLDTTKGIAYQNKGATSYLISTTGTYYSYKNTNSTVSIAIPAGFKGNVVLPFDSFAMSYDASAIDKSAVKGLTIFLKDVEKSATKKLYLDELSFIVGELSPNQIIESDFEFSGFETSVLNDFSKKTYLSCYNGIDISALHIENGKFRINLSHTASTATAVVAYEGDPSNKVGITIDVDTTELEGSSFIKFMPSTVDSPGYSQIVDGGYYYLYSDGIFYKYTISANSSCAFPKGFKGQLIIPFDQLVYAGTNKRIDSKNLSGSIRLQLQNVTKDSTKNIYFDNLSYITEEIATSGTRNQVPMGGGGYVTGLVFHPLDTTIIYARTDVGGIYRWDEDNNRWIQLSFGFEHLTRLYSVDGMAIDPNNKDVVYIAVGNGTGSGGNRVGVYKSTDRGNTWSLFKHLYFYGNSAGREYGECIQVDPNNSDVVYVATRQQGIYYTRDGGKNWTQVSTSIIPSNYSTTEGSENPYGWRSVVIDSRTTINGRSKVIYIAGHRGGIYRSTDGGDNWVKLNDAPIDVNQLRLASDGTLYLTASSGVFIYNGTTFNNISPNESLPSYCAIDVDPTNPNRLIVCNENGSKDRMEMDIWLSSDRGSTWVKKTNGRTSGQNYIKRDKISWWPQYYFSSATACIRFNPDNTKEVWFTDWYGIWMTYNIENDRTKIEWYSKVRGHEECVTTDKITLPEGPTELILGTYDNGRLYYYDINDYPLNRANGDAADLDYCYYQPNVVIQAGAGKSLFVSRDYGLTFNSVSTSIPHINVIAISATNPDNIIALGWGDGPYYTKDGGATWETSTGTGSSGNKMTSKWSRQQIIEPDGANGNVFYYSGKEGIYRSDDGGASFTLVNTTLNDYATIYSVYGKEGYLYVLQDNVLYESTDYGKTFNVVNSISTVESFSYGVGKNRNELAYYAIGVVNGERALYISDDYGKTWELMMDSKGIAVFGGVLGDMQHYGRCFLSYGGLGVSVVYK